jgi:hypothetical protein
MATSYRFFRVKNGISSFAIVEVSSRPSTKYDVFWCTSALSLKEIYAPAVEEGIKLAADEHQKRGGQPQIVEIESIVEVLSDTQPDAVRCAAALAAWKSWGYSETEVSVVFDRGVWNVLF